jgi:hypothetical protein
MAEAGAGSVFPEGAVGSTALLVLSVLAGGCAPPNPEASASGAEDPHVVSVRFTLEELDRRVPPGGG